MEAGKRYFLEASRQDSFLALSCFRDEEQSSTVRRYSRRRVCWEQVDTLCKELACTLSRAAKLPSAQDNTHINQFKKTGQLLWEHLLPKPIKDALTAVGGGTLVLLLDEELSYVPWELLHTHEDFLCLAFSIGRLIKARGSSANPRYRDSAAHLKMLILANPTADLPSAYREGLEIKKQFAHMKRRMRVDFKSTSIDTLYVKKNLREYDIVHFAGHCEYGRGESLEGAGWLLEDGRFTAHDIASLGESACMPGLVFSNACYSAGLTHSLASAFLFSGVRHYLGAIWKIQDSVSVVFARIFYGRLLRGDSVGEAVRKARHGVIARCGVQALEWAGYILYGAPDFVPLRPYVKVKRPLASVAGDIIKVRKELWKSRARYFAVAVSCLSLWWGILVFDPRGYVRYRQAYAYFAHGDNREAIARASQLVSGGNAYVPAYFLLGDAYSRLGNKDQALKYYFLYALAHEKDHRPAQQAQGYIGIGWLYHTYGEREKAYSFYTKALALSRSCHDRLIEAVALRKLAVWNIDQEEYGVALELLTKSSSINLERASAGAHRYNLACDYFDIGLVFVNKNDLETARGFYAKSFAMFEKMGLKGQMSDFYFNLGEVCYFEKEYQKALEYYERGLAIDRAQGNILSLAADFNMLGELYADMGRQEDAIRAFEQAHLLSRRIGLVPEQALALYDLGLAYQARAQKDTAGQYLRKARDLYAAVSFKECEKVDAALRDLGLP